MGDAAQREHDIVGLLAPACPRQRRVVGDTGLVDAAEGEQRPADLVVEARYTAIPAVGRQRGQRRTRAGQSFFPASRVVEGRRVAHLPREPFDHVAQPRRLFGRLLQGAQAQLDLALGAIDETEVAAQAVPRALVNGPQRQRPLEGSAAAR